MLIQIQVNENNPLSHIGWQCKDFVEENEFIISEMKEMRKMEFKYNYDARAAVRFHSARETVGICIDDGVVHH